MFNQKRKPLHCGTFLALGNNKKGFSMLRITMRPEGRSTRLLVEGGLVGLWVSELARYWRSIADTPYEKIIVDLSEVTFIDHDGKILLTEMWEKGAKLHAVSCLNKCIVEEIMRGNSKVSDSSMRNSESQENA
jgi:hypothetical protein